MLVAQTRARQDHRRQAGVADVDRQARRHQHRVARRERDRLVQAGAQVQAGAAGRRVGGKLLGHAAVEHLEIDGGHGVNGKRVGMPPSPIAALAPGTAGAA